MCMCVSVSVYVSVYVCLCVFGAGWLRVDRPTQLPDLGLDFLPPLLEHRGEHVFHGIMVVVIKMVGGNKGGGGCGGL